MNIRSLITAGLIALTAVPLISSAQQAAATQADVTALPPALRAALLSGNAAAIEAAITTLSGGDAQRAGQLAGLVARAASFVAQTNPAAAAAGAQAAVAVANRPAVIAANPAASAQTAQQAMQVASLPAVMAAAPAAVATVTQSAMQVIAAPSVQAAAPTLAAQVAASATIVSQNPAVQAASPGLAAQVGNQVAALPVAIQQPAQVLVLASQATTNNPPQTCGGAGQSPC
ncbi:MAG: hypothetical protein HZA62_15625 [Rhodocyclales bacterium]|nr:hypothetical protein [Rhodocyclales bacterium]